MGIKVEVLEVSLSQLPPGPLRADCAALVSLDRGYSMWDEAPYSPFLCLNWDQLERSQGSVGFGMRWEVNGTLLFCFVFNIFAIDRIFKKYFLLIFRESRKQRERETSM